MASAGAGSIGLWVVYLDKGCVGGFTTHDLGLWCLFLGGWFVEWRALFGLGSVIWRQNTMLGARSLGNGV